MENSFCLNELGNGKSLIIRLKYLNFGKWELIKHTWQKTMFFFKAAIVSKSNKGEDAWILNIIFCGDSLALELSFFSSLVLVSFLLHIHNAYYITFL